MNPRSLAGHLGTLLVAVLVAVVVLGAIFGQPLLVSFVTSGSMEPSLTPGDGFVVVPKAVAGPVGPGDVIVYDAERLHNGGLVTHRVVDETERGFITKGDANAFIDQGDGEPPVKSAQVVGVAVQYRGSVVAIPHLGTAFGAVNDALGSVQSTIARTTGTRAVLGTSGLAYLIFAGSVLWYGLGLWQERTGRARRRSTSRDTGQSVHLIVGTLVIVVVVAATVGMAGPAGKTQYDFVSAHYDSDGTRVLESGTSETTVHPMGNGGPVPMVVFLEPANPGIDVSPEEVYLDGRSGANATVTLTAPPDIGYYSYYMVEHRYFAILPQPVIRGLHEYHPWAPVVVIDGLLAIVFYVLGVGVAETGRVRLRSRDVPYQLRLRRWLRRRY
jgi:signal peptidase